MEVPDAFHARVLQTTRFEVSLLRSGTGEQDPGGEALTDGNFQECSGLELEADVREYLEGGRNDGVVRRIGRVKLQPVVLKRGLFTTEVGAGADTELWDWLQGMVSGVLPVPRYDGVVAVKDPTRTSVQAVWRFFRGLPLKVVGPALNAKTGEIAIEELHIVHEGLRMERR
ncbi:phage tail-like protein [Streptomyces sp. SAI-126]|uniref:phage tail protein n=1 Tax=unclassified Streptomyces TaxID=2593676 RepID=UPI0036ED8219